MAVCKMPGKKFTVVRKLLSKIDTTTTTRIFQAKHNWDKNKEGVWFTGQPLGKNTVGTLMRNISQTAQLSSVNTNHCVRATCISCLAEAGVDDNVTMSTSGHKSVQPFASYHAPNDQTKEMKAAVLDRESGVLCPAVSAPLPSLL